MLKSLLLSSMLLNLGILLGRVSGFIRESFVGSIYGVGSEADIVVLMLTVPDILVNILMGGALGAALIPEFIKAPEAARRLLFQSILFFGLLFFLLAVYLYFNMDLLISLLAPGFSDERYDKSVNVVCWVIWLVPLTVMAGVTTSYLQVKNQYAIPSIGTLLVNLSIIAGLIVVSQLEGDLYILSVFVVLGGLLRLLSQIARVGNINISPLKSSIPFIINKALIFRYIQAVASGSTLLLFPVIARSQATYLEGGSVAVMNYASKLIEFPMTLTVTFLSVVLFPVLSKSYFKSVDSHATTVKHGLQVTLILSFVVASSLSAISEAYSSVVFGYGRMTPDNIKSISDLASLGMLLLPAVGMSTYLTSVFNARQNTLTPLIVNIVGLISFILLCKTGFYGADLSGVMLSMISGYIITGILLLKFLHIKSIKWTNVLFEIRFFLSVLIGSVLVYIICSYIKDVSVSNWQTIILAALSSAFFLIIVALLNNKVRDKFIMKLREL